jgi:polyhydroxyalkanoate synthesis regulator protein
MARQNMELFQRAATMFTPLPGANENGEATAPTPPAADVDANTSSQIKELNDKIEDLQKQISELVTAQQDRT